ncbi:MAG: Hpt domain [Actinomycetota bacterium]|jgi:HPt (histidine-containing phosphotransfer) domain-containing protein
MREGGTFGAGGGSALLVAGKLPAVNEQVVAFDLERIEQYRSMIGVEGAEDMVRLFLRSLPERRVELRDAIAAGDLERIRKAGHAIKGMAAAVGANALSAIGLGLQHADAHDVEELVQRLEPTAEEAVTGIAAAWRVELA